MCGLCPGGWARPTMRATRAAKARITALPATFTTSKIKAKRTRGRSQHRHPAVHGEGLTDDVARPRTAQPQHGRGDLLGPARAADRNVLRDLGVRLLVPAHDIAGHLRVDQARVDRVHANAVLDILQGRRPRQADHAVLGGDVGADPGVAGQRTDRGVVDDGAAALALHLPQLVLHAAPHAAQVDPDDAIPVLAGAVGGRGMWAITPALSNAASSRPNAATVRSTIAATWASSLTSHWTAKALRPAAASCCAAVTTSSLKSAS